MTTYSGAAATRHQREVGAEYFDDVTQTIVAGTISITALAGSTDGAISRGNPLRAHLYE
jgi:isocitrate lyase